jgi:hypothetical protein
VFDNIEVDESQCDRCMAQQPLVNIVGGLEEYSCYSDSPGHNLINNRDISDVSLEAVGM